MDFMSHTPDDRILMTESAMSIPKQDIQYALLHGPIVAEPQPINNSAEATESDTEESDDADNDVYGREDVEGVMGPSISRAASYIATHRTHPAEKEAVNTGEDGTLYDSNGSNEAGTRTTTIPTSYVPESPAPAVLRKPKPNEEKHKQLSTHTTHHHLPHISFLGVKRSTSKKSTPGKPIGRTRRAMSNSGETLKRFLPSMPSMAKAGSFMPSMPSSPFFGGSSSNKNKRNSLHGKIEGRSRASSLNSCMSGSGRSERRNSIPRHIRSKNHSADDLIVDDDLETPPNHLRRVTSETALYTQMSKVTIHGDDSRWVNQREMVNSRFKAIMDSLEDRASFRVPNFRVPTLPAMPTFEISMPGSKKDEKGERKLSKKRSPDTSTTSLPTVQEPKDELDKALATLTGDVVIMGGYRGSILRSAKPSHRRLWVPVKVGLNIRRVNLEVGLNEEDEERMEESIFASGMLTNIGPVDISRRLIKRMEECENAKAGKLRVHDYGYDWRLSPHILARKLKTFLEGLGCNKPDKDGKIEGATVIAHSLGGLITRYVVNQRPELFKGVIYAGTPQACINILGPLRNGDEVLLSSKVLTAQVNFSLRTSFLLLPTHGKGFFDKNTGEGIPLDFFDVEQWIKYRFSPCIDPPLPAYMKGKEGLMEKLTVKIPGRKQSNSISKSTTPTSTSRQSTLNSSNSDSDRENPVRQAGEKVREEARDAVPNKVSINPDMSSTPHNESSNHINSPHLNSHLNPPFPRADAIAYLARILPQIKQFKLDLQHREDHETRNRYPPFAVLYGHSCATVASVKVHGSKNDQYESSIAATDVYDDLGFGDGDGVVLVREAMIPSGYRIVQGGIVGSERGHLGLCGDLVAMGGLLSAINRGRERGIGLGREEPLVKGVETSDVQMRQV